MPCEGHRAGLGATKVGFEFRALGAPQPGGLTENLEASGKLTFLAPGPPAGTMVPQLCRRRVAGSVSVQEPAPQLGEDLPPPRRPAAPQSQDVGRPGSGCPRPQPPPRHAPPGRAATAGPPVAGLSRVPLPQLSTLRQWPQRVSEGPA